MKINWGTKIAIVYSLFVIGILSLVIFSTTLSSDLVTENYYQEDLAHQQKIDKIINAKRLEKTVMIIHDFENEQLEITFPFDRSAITGKIILYRPSNAGSDKVIAIQPSSGKKQKISLQGLEKGLWKVEVDWKNDNTGYYNHQNITLP